MGWTPGASCARGTLVSGDATGRVQNLTLGAANRVMRSDGTDLAWGQIVAADITASTITPAQVEADFIRYTDTQVTNAQMLALLGTDIALVAAPGAARALLVHSIYFYFDSTTAYTIGTAVLAVGYGGDGADIMAITEAGFVDQGTDQARFYQVGAAAATPAIITPVVNQTVVLRATTADMTGGNAANTVSIRVWHSTVDMAAFT